MIPVMLLISCFSIMILKTNGYVGSKLPLRLFFFRLSVPLFTAIERKKKQQKKNVSWSPKQFFFSSPSFFRETQRGGITFLITYSDSYSKRFRGPQSLHCWGVSPSLLLFIFNGFVKTGSDAAAAFPSKGRRLIASTLSPFRFQTDQCLQPKPIPMSFSSCTEMRVLNNTKVVLLYYHFSPLSLSTLSTVKCTYPGPSSWSDSHSPYCRFQDSFFSFFFWICCFP